MWVLLEETGSMVRMQGGGLGTHGDKEEAEEPEKGNEAVTLQAPARLSLCPQEGG